MGIVAAAFAVATISACDKSPVADEQVINTTISVLGDNVLKADSSADTLVVRLSLSGVNAAEKVEVVSSAEWVSVATASSTGGGSSSGGSLWDDIFSKAEGGENSPSGDDSSLSEEKGTEHIVRLSIAENESSASRTATVKFIQKGAKDVKITIIQAANADYVVNSQVTFTLDVTEVKEATAKFTVAPSISDCYYVYAFVAAEQYDSYSEPRAFVEDNVAKIKEYAAQYEQKYETPFPLKDRLYKGYVSSTATGLTPSTEYCLVAFDLTLNYAYSGNVAVYKFKTGSVQPSSSAFSVTYDESTGIVMFTPTGGTSGSFGCGVCSAEYWDSAKAPSAVVDSYVGSTSFSSYSVSDGARGYPMKSLQDAVDGTEYVGFAFSYNTSTKAASNISWLKFTFHK